MLTLNLTNQYGVLMIDASPARLLRYLEEMGITNKRLGKLCGVSPNTVSRWLNGHSPVPHSVIRMLALKQRADQGVSMVKVMYWGDPDEMDATERTVEASDPA